MSDQPFHESSKMGYVRDVYPIQMRSSIINKSVRRKEKIIGDILVCCISILAGIQLTTSVCYTFFPEILIKKCNVKTAKQSPIQVEPIMPQSSPQFVEDLGQFQFHKGPKKKLVLVGIMTSHKYFKSRDWAIQMTWTKTIPGDVAFFVGNSTEPAPEGLPLIRLNRVPDNVYPPQGKVFEMLKYMYINHADNYEYFVRADDDVFIKGQELGSLLRSLNSSQNIYMGHYGQGIPEEKGKLGMGKDFFYCIGGPGVIFSHKALKVLAPNLDNCKGDTATFHEDTELGRCVENYLKEQCKSNRKVRQLFYQNYREVKGTFNHELGVKESHAITLHPVKNSSFVIRMDIFFKNDRIKFLKSRMNSLKQDINLINRSIIRKYKPQKKDPVYKYLHEVEAINKAETKDKFRLSENKDEEVVWEQMDTRSIYSFSNIHQAPKQNLEVRKNTEFLQTALNALYSAYTEGSDLIKIKNFLGAYKHVSPISGVQHLLRVHLLQRRTKNGYHNTTFLSQQALGPLNFIEEEELFKRRFKINTKNETQINLILPISGKAEAFKRFVKSLDDIFRKKKNNLRVILVVYKDNDGLYKKQISMMENLQLKYDCFKLKVLFMKGEFTRGIALQDGMKECNNDSLLLFIDIDMVITETFLHRVRVNTIYERQVYFPIYYSEFDPQTFCPKKKCNINHFKINKDSGLWRYFGFGMVSIYKKDFIMTGGYDTSIEGWGKEDLDFYEQCLRSNLTVIRAPDITLVHVYHSKYCSHELNPTQYEMCLGSKSGIYRSLHTEASNVYKLSGILNRKVV